MTDRVLEFTKPPRLKRKRKAKKRKAGPGSVERLEIDKKPIGPAYRFSEASFFAGLTLLEAWEKYGVSWVINPKTEKPISFVPWMLHQLSCRNWIIGVRLKGKFKKMIKAFKLANPTYTGHMFNKAQRAKSTINLLKK